MPRKLKIGTVISNKMDKSAVIAITSLKPHVRYKKKYKVTKKLLVHDENNEVKIGDLVEIKEVRPMSKRKHYSVKKIMQVI